MYVHVCIYTYACSGATQPMSGVVPCVLTIN